MILKIKISDEDLIKFPDVYQTLNVAGRSKSKLIINLLHVGLEQSNFIPTDKKTADALALMLENSYIRVRNSNNNNSNSVVPITIDLPSKKKKVSKGSQKQNFAPVKKPIDNLDTVVDEEKTVSSILDTSTTNNELSVDKETKIIGNETENVKKPEEPSVLEEEKTKPKKYLKDDNGNIVYDDDGNPIEEVEFSNPFAGLGFDMGDLL